MSPLIFNGHMSLFEKEGIIENAEWALAGSCKVCGIFVLLAHGNCRAKSLFGGFVLKKTAVLVNI